MSRRLTKEESRAIKRAMRATRYISQRMNYGYVDDEGLYIIQSGGPGSGELLEACQAEDGTWELKSIGMWTERT
jgi:hypothetical protein